MKGSVKSDWRRNRNQLSAPAETVPEMYLAMMSCPGSRIIAIVQRPRPRRIALWSSDRAARDERGDDVIPPAWRDQAAVAMGSHDPRNQDTGRAASGPGRRPAAGASSCHSTLRRSSGLREALDERKQYRRAGPQRKSGEERGCTDARREAVSPCDRIGSARSRAAALRRTRAAHGSARPPEAGPTGSPC